MWEMRLKQRTKCTVTAGSVTVSLVHSRMGNDWVCWAKEGVLQNVWLLPCCWKRVVAFVSDRSQLWGASVLFLLCQGELQRSWNLTYHRFLGCEDTGSDISDGVNPEQVNGLQRSTGRGAASFLSDGGEGYHSLSSLLNLPFHKSVWVRYYKPLLLFSATHSAWKWILSAALGSHWRLVDKVQAWVASVVDWTVFSPKTYGFWQWFQDFPLEKDSRLCHRPTVSPLANSVTFPRLSHPSHLFGL